MATVRIPCTDSSIIVTQEGEICRAHRDAIIHHCLFQIMGMVQSSLSSSRDSCSKKMKRIYIYRGSCWLSVFSPSFYSPPFIWNRFIHLLLMWPCQHLHDVEHEPLVVSCRFWKDFTMVKLHILTRSKSNSWLDWLGSPKKAFISGKSCIALKRERPAGSYFIPLSFFLFPSLYFLPRFQNHRQTMRTLQGRRQQQQRNEPSSSAEHDTNTVTGNTTTTTTTLASSAMGDPVPEQRTQMPPPPAVSSSSYTNMLEVSSSLSHMQVNSSPRQAFSFTNQPQTSLQVSTHAARLPPFSSFVQDQPHTVASSMPPRAATSSSSYFSAFTPTSTIQQQSPATTINSTTTANAAASGAGRVLSTPGTARLPPIQFYFHHPEFGIESTMLQLSTFGKANQSSSSG